VGGGEEEAIAQAVARSGVADAVTLAGFVAEMDPEYRRADVVLSCSPIEGMGRTTAEAMSYGLPVVGCDSLGTAELIEHAVTGLLCDGSAAGVAGALARLLGDPTAARRMGANAQRMARERFTNERCTAASLALLARVIAGRPGLHGSQLPACPE
jgi:glycosyltransferase involved in cell wall biosynthesis